MSAILYLSRSMDRSEIDLVLAARARGHDIIAMTGPAVAGVAELQAAGCYLQPRRYTRKFSWGFIRQLRTLVRERSIVLIHAMDSKSLSNALFACRGLAVRFIAYRGTLARIRRWDPSYYLAILNRRVERVICVNRSIHDYMQRFYPPERLVLAYKGYEVDWAQEMDDLPLDLPDGLPDEAWVLCYIANTRGRPHKGLRHLVAAAHLLSDDRIHVLVIGSHDAADAQAAADGPAAARIHLLGERPQAARYLRRANAFVLPSTRDGLPRSIKEAMARALPCIVTDIPGPSELIEDGHSGLLVPPGDPQALATAITRLAADPAAAKAMGQAARQRLRTHFAPEVFSRTIIGVYEEMVGSAAQTS